MLLRLSRSKTLSDRQPEKTQSTSRGKAAAKSTRADEHQSAADRTAGACDPSEGCGRGQLCRAGVYSSQAGGSMKALSLALVIAVLPVSQPASGPIAGSWTATFEGRTFIRLDIETVNGAIAGGISVGDFEVDRQGLVSCSRT